MYKDLKNKLDKNFILTRLGIGLLLIYMGFLLYNSIFQNYKTSKKVDGFNAKISELQKEKGQLEALTNYYKTETFQEIEAKKKLGLKMPGEIVVPVETLKEEEEKDSQKKKIENTSKMDNFYLWIDAFFGRNS